jgi:gliding motility-associated-like protein
MWNTTPSQNAPHASNLSAGVYTIQITDSMGCQKTDTVQIFEPLPLSDAWLVKPVTCKGASNGELTIQVYGGTAPYTYQWNTTPLGTASQITGLQSGLWQVSVTDANGCDTVFRYTMINPDSITVGFHITNETCAGYCDGTILATVIGGVPPYNYLWSSSVTDTAHIVTDLCPGGYTLLLTDSLGCSSLSEPLNIQPGLSVDASFSYNPDPVYAGMDVGFTYTGTQAATWWWDFGNGNNSGVIHPSGIRFTDGKFIVTLIASTGSPHHCTDTALQLITVLEDPRIFVPNAFKPNGDGTNDRFYPKTIGIELLEWAIYNRWGQAIFRSENPGEGWDGNINGIPAPEGVYAWVLRYRNPKTGEVHKSRGTVTLLR